MRFATLASGSKGNATLIEHGSQLVLVDCGLSLRETVRRMRELGVELADITAIALTHEHIDHIKSLVVLAAHTGLAPYMSDGTAAKLGLRRLYYQRVVADAPQDLGDGLALKPHTVPHDAREPLMYTFSVGTAKLALATDIGAPNNYLRDRLTGCGALLLECNYDPQMLLDNTDYPEFVKQRIRGTHGHLSNKEAGTLLAQLAHVSLRTVVVAHLSENNNTPTKALDALKLALRNSGFSPALHMATQHTCSTWFEVVPN